MYISVYILCIYSFFEPIFIEFSTCLLKIGVALRLNNFLISVMLTLAIWDVDLAAKGANDTSFPEQSSVYIYLTPIVFSYA